MAIRAPTDARARPGERRAMQRRGAPRPRARVRVRARRQQRAHALRVALARGVVQRRVPAVAADAVVRADVRSPVKHGAELVDVAALRRDAGAAHELDLLEALVVGGALVVGVPAATHRASGSDARPSHLGFLRRDGTER